MNKVLSIKTEPREASFSRSYRHIDVDNDVTLDDLLTPGFWAHHASALKEKDLLDVLSEDYELDVQLRVIEVGVGFVVMRKCVVRHDRNAKADAEAQAEADNDEGQSSELPVVPRGYKVGFTPSRKYYVQSTHVKPAEIVSDQHATRREAHEAAIEYDAKIKTRVAA